MTGTLTHTAAPPTDQDTLAALTRAGRELGRDVAYFYGGSFHFPIEDGWTVAIRAESGGRFRVEACRWTRPGATLWALAEDDERLASLVTEMASEIERVREHA